MQDAAINSTNTSAYGDGGSGSGSTNLNNSGVYEFVLATSALAVGGGTVNISGTGPTGGLLYAYTNAAATGTQGQRRFQVVRVPQFPPPGRTHGRDTLVRFGPLSLLS